MKKVITHLIKSPFVLFTSIAALIHSSWALSAIFGGREPDMSWAWVGWVIPGFLLAASIDVGLLSTALAVERGDRSKARLVTFVVLAVSMFLLQFFYAETHYPDIALSAGVRQEWVSVFTLVRDAMIVIGPLLLPTAITLHTFANRKEVEPIIEVTSTALVLPSGITAKCPYCEWTRNFETGFLAQRALDLHQKTCDGLRIELPVDKDTKLLK
jgi:hypothetical protein